MYRSQVPDVELKVHMGIQAKHALPPLIGGKLHRSCLVSPSPVTSFFTTANQNQRITVSVNKDISQSRLSEWNWVVTSGNRCLGITIGSRFGQVSFALFEASVLRSEAVRVALAAGVNKWLAIAGRRVEEDGRVVRPAIAGRFRQKARVTLRVVIDPLLSHCLMRKQFLNKVVQTASIRENASIQVNADRIETTNEMTNDLFCRSETNSQPRCWTSSRCHRSRRKWTAGTFRTWNWKSTLERNRNRLSD